MAIRVLTWPGLLLCSKEAVFSNSNMTIQLSCHTTFLLMYFSCLARIREIAPVIIGDAMTDVTRILSEIEHGDPSAADQLLPLVYDELRKLASTKLAHEKPGQTLQATALVHEAYIRLVESEQARPWDNRRHFFAAAAEAMRRILIERARKKQSLKGGGGRQRVALEASEASLLPMACDDLLALDEAIQKLEQRDPRKAEVVKLRFFAGLTTAQAAKSLAVSVSTAENDWAYARCWLRLEISGDETS